MVAGGGQQAVSVEQWAVERSAEPCGVEVTQSLLPIEAPSATANGGAGDSAALVT
jgi:hypothetical protein